MALTANFMIVNAEDLRNSGNELPETAVLTVISDGKYFNGTEMVPLNEQWKVAPLEGLEGRILNLTPQVCGVKDDAGVVHRIRASGFTARAVEKDEYAGLFHGVSLVEKVYAETLGLPPEGIPVLISTIAAAGCRGRQFTFIPDSGGTCVRQGNGQMDYATQLIAA